MKTLNSYLTEGGLIRRGMKISTKKYELSNDTKKFINYTLYRIQALRDFKTINGEQVKAGDLGGWVENEDNLDQAGNCWIGGSAWVTENARVSEDACIYGNAFVYGNAQVYGSAEVYDHTRVFDNAQVYGSAQVGDRAWIYGSAQVYGNARVDYNVSKGKITK